MDVIPNVGLKIAYGCPDECMFYIDMEFEELYEPYWLKNERNLKILRDIDNAMLCQSGLCDIDETDRTFSIYEISSGAKALMICNMQEKTIIWGTIFSDNCAELLLEIAEERDITIYLEHLLLFNPKQFKAYSLVNNKYYDSYAEYIIEAGKELVR